VYRKQAMILLATLSFSLHGSAAETLIAVAANFSEPMRDIASAFERQSGHRVRLSFGASGKLYAQILHGAPYDAFLSADNAKPAALEAADLTVPGSRFTYAIGALVLWSASGADARNLLERGTYQRLAIANPRLAPYGAAAETVLQRLALLEAARPRLVTGENIGQTYQFVASGNASLGFVARAQVLRGGELPEGAWSVPASLHAPIAQDAVLLRHGADNPAAGELLDYLRGAAALAVLQRYGYRPGGGGDSAP
jgi:molybdate transport system substrate-binding protein